MSLGTLWTVPVQPQGKYIRAAAAIGGIKIDLPESYTHFEDNKKPEFLSKFPHGKIPAWEGKDGFLLAESYAIGRYISSLAPNSTLLGSSPQEAALVDQWSFFAATELQQYASLINLLVRGVITPYNKPIHQAYAERELRSLKTLNEHLSTRTFLVSERITLADLVVAATLQRSFSITLDAPLRAQLTHVVRFFETVVNQPNVKDIFGETTYIEKALQYVPPAKEKKEPKAEEKKAEKKAEKKPKVEEDEEDEKPFEEPKAKNPLDSLPKSTFNLEDWKRAYSNLDTRGTGGAIEWFYDKFDKEGFSIWRVDFKYPEELTLTFMSSNLITGFFNRLEASRKYLFGSVGVLGTNNNSVISGVFILRGDDYKPVVDAAPDWESYDFKKIDLENADDKAFFESALAWDLKIGDKEWADGKNFK
ncbi:hypothetical protein M0805_004029 [Coniferiporia weirii]|nr:hypothetical protein M0805_004029 [Coniferiporia weirii]